MAPLPSLSRAALAAIALAASAGPGLAAQPGATPDWPCVQRLVPELAPAQMWTGKPLDQLPADAQLAPALHDLPQRLADRNLPLDEAKRLVDQALAQVPEAERDDQRALLFRDTLARLNDERGQMIAGIESFARGQRQLADRITAQGRELVQLRKDPAQAAAVQDETNARSWDMRVFDERQHSLRTLCDQPVQVDQRAFALAKIIEGQST
jgi:hypothetical protein